MIKQDILNTFNSIAVFLEEKRLKEAFDILKVTLSKLQNWQLSEELDNLEDTYKRMLIYLTNGAQDPEREKVFNELLYSVYGISDKIELDQKTNYNFSYFYDLRRSHLLYNQDSIENLCHTLDDVMGKIALLSLLEENTDELIQYEKQKETIIRKIFNAILLSEQWEANQKKTGWEILNNQLYPLALSGLIITALTLNLLEIFDEQKAILLFEAAENENEEIKQRALTGIVLFLRKYDKRLYLYPSIIHRLQHLAENATFVKQICQILLQFIFCRETEKITKKITDEIITQMIKITPKLNHKILMDDWNSETGQEDRNPEWMDLIKKAGIEEKMQEISELQMEGADVMHSSFSQLKDYSFFNELSNWFMPFFIVSEFMNNDEMSELAQTLMKSRLMCNSDKYSLFFTISLMPENYRKMTLKQLSAESKSVKEVLDAELDVKSKKINDIVRQYIQDLYRFYKIHPRKKDFEDIFEQKPEFYQTPSIAKLITGKENLSIIGEFYFNKNYFKEAADIYDQLLLEEPNNNILYQKKGYCLQMQGNLKNALDVYLKAELLNVNNSWIIKKLAHCYRLLKQPEEALAYYKKAEQLNPDNLSVQMNIGHCYLELKNYNEALKYYFKVDYLEKNKQKAWRPLAWCSFLVGKYGQAEDYYQKIMETNPDAADYLNAGHTQLAVGNYKEAIRLYGLSLKSTDNSAEKFRELFMNDIPEIIQTGIKKEDIPLILDQILYDE